MPVSLYACFVVRLHQHIYLLDSDRHLQCKKVKSASHILPRNKRKQVFTNLLPIDFHCKTLKLACLPKGHLVK